MALAQPEMLAVVLDDLVGPPLPPVAEVAWRVFGELSATRASGMGGIGAITFTELLAYQTLTDTRLTPLDVLLVREADQAFVQWALQRVRRAETRDDPFEDGAD